MVGPAAMNGTILLVEHDHGDAVLVQAYLSAAGVPASSVTWVRSLSDALAAVATKRPDTILLDLGLPDADGVGAVHKLVDAAPGSTVITLAGQQDRDDADALGAGAQDHLAKDIITAELLERSMRYARERTRAQRAEQQLHEVRLGVAEKSRLERGLLPIPLLHSDVVACDTYYRPGRDDAVLGGDFFDVVETSDGRVRAVIGDVMGHGPDEAALGVHLRVAWRSLLLAGVPDERVLPTLALLLEAEQGDSTLRYATVCDVTIETGDSITVRVAGHPAPVICAEGRSRYLDLEIGPPLGVRTAVATPGAG